MHSFLNLDTFNCICYQSVLERSHDYWDFSVSWLTDDEGRVIEAWSAVGYWRWWYIYYAIPSCLHLKPLFPRPDTHWTFDTFVYAFQPIKDIYLHIQLYTVILTIIVHGLRIYLLSLSGP
jgi:hypothetical protein